MMKVAERHESLWSLVVSPALWALHLLASYITVAIFCGKIASRDDALGPARVLVLVYTAVALMLVVATGVRGYARERALAEPRHADTEAARHRFLGYTTALLSALSAIAIVFGTLPVLYLGSCR